MDKSLNFQEPKPRLTFSSFSQQKRAVQVFLILKHLLFSEREWVW